MARHAAAGRHEDEEERAEHLGEQAPPFLAGILEVGDAIDHALLVARDRALHGNAGGDGHEPVTGQPLRGLRAVPLLPRW